MKLLSLFIALSFASSFDSSKSLKDFRTVNLVSWCIVPYDAENRDPEARSKILEELGITKCAYDWRAENVPSFQEKIIKYKKHGIKYLAFWRKHNKAFELFEEHGIHPKFGRPFMAPRMLAGSSRRTWLIKRWTKFCRWHKEPRLWDRE